MIEKIKNLVWLAVVIFSVCGFVQTLLNLNPRISNLEGRIVGCEDRTANVENRVSGIELKLDIVLARLEEQNKDIKDIYHLIMDRHK